MPAIRDQTNNPLLHDVVPFRPSSPIKQQAGVLRGIKNVSSAIYKWSHKPVIAWGWNVNPIGASPENPEEALRKISTLSKEGLQRAERGGIKEDPQLSRAHGNLLNERLRRTSDADAANNPGLVGPVAELPVINPQVTRAIDLETRVAAIDWKKETEQHRNNLCKKLSAFSVVMQMRDRAGIQEEHNLNLLRLADIATKPGETRSIWKLFTEQYKLTWLQKIRAGSVYWVYYQTSLISNTVEAYVKAFIKGTTKDLTSDNDQARFDILKKILENTNEFLVEDIRATKAFAFATEAGTGDLEKYRKRAIEAHYNGSLAKLCKKFSETRVEKDHPHVDFFVDAQKIPVVGLLFTVLEWLLNRYVVRSSMKNSILPPTLESAVKNGLEVTQPHNLPFALAETRFLTTQLENLSNELENGTPSKTPPKLPGTEILSPTIKNLKQVLDLEDLKTQPELRQKFAEIEAGKWYLDRKVEEVIEEGIKEGCHYLFDYLNKTAKSSELISHLLELSCAPFSNQAKDPAVLMAEFTEEQLKLERVAKAVFRKLIRSAVAKKFDPTKPEDSKKIAEATFEEGRTVTKVTFDKLKELCDRMTDKVNRAAQAPTPENNVQQEIASLLQILQVFAGRKELQEKIDELDELDRQAVWRELAPLFARVVKLQEKILVLQKHQGDYPFHAAIESQMKFIKDFLDNVRREFHEQPRHMRNPLKTTLEKSCEEIAGYLGPDAPVTKELERTIQALSDLSDSIVKEQQVLDALHAFYPPRLAEQQGGGAGLLDQLLHYELGTHPRGFQPKAALSAIDKYLTSFPPEEQRELRELIGNGSNLKAKWAQLGAVLQRIYQVHFDLKNRDSIQFNETLRKEAQWAQGIIQSYTLVKGKDHDNMQKTVREISVEIESLRNLARTIQVTLPFHLSSTQTKMITSAVGAAAGSSALTGTLTWLGSFFGPIGSAVGYGVGAIANAAAMAGPENLGSVIAQKPGAIAKTLAWISGGVAANYMFPGGAAYLGAARGAQSGWNAEKAVHAYSQDKVLPEVEAIFKNAYRLCLSPRIYHAATTRTLKALSEPEEIYLVDAPL